MSRNTTSREDDTMATHIGGVIRLDAADILEFIQDNYQPEEVYDKGELDAWAEANGYVKE